KGGSAPATECDFPCGAMPTQLWLQRSRARRELRARYRVDPLAVAAARAPGQWLVERVIAFIVQALKTQRVLWATSRSRRLSRRGTSRVIAFASAGAP